MLRASSCPHCGDPDPQRTAEEVKREKEVEEEPLRKINLRGKAVHGEGVEGEPQVEESHKRINLRAKPAEDVGSEANEKEEG